MTDFESGVCVGMLLKSGGSSAKLQTLNVGSNGIYYPDTGYDGFSNVTVAVRPRLTTLSVTENGTYTPPSAYDGFDVVRVNCSDRYQEGYQDGVNSVIINSLTVTENGTYNAANYGCNGFDPVNVNVPDNYDSGYSDGYSDGYGTSFEVAEEYYNEPDLTKQYYVYVVTGTNQYGEYKNVECGYYDTSDMSNKYAIGAGWIADSIYYSYDTKIVSIEWVQQSTNRYNMKVKAIGYTQNHSESKIATFNFTLKEGITPSNATVGYVIY